MKIKFALTMLLSVTVLCTSSLAQEKTAGDWLKEGRSLMLNGSGSFDPAADAFNKAIQLDPENVDAWLGKAQVLSDTNLKNESLEAFQKALDLADEILKQNPQDAGAWQSQGIALASLGRDKEAAKSFEKSVEILNQSIETNPHDAEAWWLKADSLDILGQSQGALEAYDRVIELNSSKAAGAWIRKSDILVSSGKYNESLDAFDNATKLMAANDTSIFNSWWGDGTTVTNSAWFYNGQILRVSSGWYNQSSHAYENVLQINSNLVVAWQSKGWIITPQGRTLRSLGKHNEILTMSGPNWASYYFPSSNESSRMWVDYWMNRAGELSRTGSFQESVAAIDKAIEIEPQNATLWDAKASRQSIAANFSGNRSQYNESLKAQDKAIELNPGNSTLHIHKAVLIASLADLSGHQNKSLYQDAIRELDKAIELDPQNKDAWNYRGSVLDTRLNRSAEALLAYGKAIELDGENDGDNESLSNAWSGKGTALAKLGRYNESFEAFDKAIELNPQTSAFVWLSKGKALNESGRYGEALAAYDKVIELVPDSANGLTAQAYESKGDVLLAWGKQSEAVNAYDKAIEQYPLEPMGAQTWHKKSIALKALGQTAEADAASARAKELGYQG